MQKGRKAIALSVLLVIAVIIYAPKKDKRPKSAAPKQALIALGKVLPEVTSAHRVRSQFTDWGRNPFVWSGTGVKTSIADLSVSGIMWDEVAPSAIINGELLHPGDTVGDLTIKGIEPNKVILTDGTEEYILGLE